MRTKPTGSRVIGFAHFVGIARRAFKLFLYICLNARRDSGALDTTQTELARSLTKAPGTIRRCLSEMEKAGICQTRFGHNPTGQGTIQITESYWPYRRGETQTAAAEAADTYVAEIRKMLDAIGVKKLEDLFQTIPKKVRLSKPLKLPEPLSEPELLHHFQRLQAPLMSSFLGAGAYHHFIPAVVSSLTSRSEFYTAYTPYQPEIRRNTSSDFRIPDIDVSIDRDGGFKCLPV